MKTIILFFINSLLLGVNSAGAGRGVVLTSDDIRSGFVSTEENKVKNTFSKNGGSIGGIVDNNDGFTQSIYFSGKEPAGI